MSLRAMLWALELPIENVGAKFVLVALAEHAGDHNGEDWQCYPSVERLGKFTSQKPRTIERHLVWLWSNGYISRERRQVRVVKDTKKGVYNYTLHWQPEDRAERQRVRSARVNAPANMADTGIEFCSGHFGVEHPPISTVAPANVAATIIDEPPIEPVIEPGADATGDAGAADQQHGFAGELIAVPEEIRTHVVSEPQLGEGWARSWLDFCGFNPKTKALHPRTEFARGRIRENAGKLLASLGVTLGEPVASR